MTAPRRRSPQTVERRPRHARLRRRRTWPGAAALAVALFATTGAGWAYSDLSGNIDGRDVDQLLGPEEDRPETAEPTDPSAGRPVNLLLVGSDDRSGENTSIGGGSAQAGVRSDTVIVAHISADRSRVELVSIPRDSWVEIPACELPDGSMTDPVTRKFNGAFELGGQTGDVAYAAACTIRTVESLTDVRIDGFVAVDFGGFVDMVDAIGGVPMCIPEAVDDDDAHVRLEAGMQTLDGQQALGYARARKSIGDGSDTGRIGRQQALLAATVRQVLDKNILTDAPALYAFLDAATASLTTSSNYGSLASLAGLASSMRGIDADDVVFVTVPWAPRGDGANVVWTDEADELWAALAADRPLAVAGSDEEPSSDPPPPDASAAPTTPTGPTLEGTTADDRSDACG